MIISAPIIGTLIFATIATLILPIVILLVLCLRHKISQKPMWFGVLAFFVSQACLRLPLLSVLRTQSWFIAFSKQNTIFYVILLAFTAGLFEETARYIGARFCLKKEREYRDAIGFGLGHGFCECILVVGLTEFSNLTTCLMINSGVLTASTAVGKQTINVLLTITTSVLLMAVWERISTVFFHVFATVLIFRGVREGKIYWYLLALAAHTIVDSVPILVAGSNLPLYESIIFAAGVLGLIYVLKAKPKFQNSERCSG